MRRYPAYDPPEYLNWQPDAKLVEAYGSRLHADAGRRRVVDSLDEARC
jgi:hypothetical protein